MPAVRHEVVVTPPRYRRLDSGVYVIVKTRLLELHGLVHVVDLHWRQSNVYDSWSWCEEMHHEWSDVPFATHQAPTCVRCAAAMRAA